MDVRTRRHLVDRGVMTTDRVTTRPVPRHCRRCGRAIISALVDDGPAVPGVRADLDPRRVNAAGEWQARLAGLTTYAVRRAYVVWRDPGHIAAHPAHTVDVHHAHACEPPPIEYEENK